MGWKFKFRFCKAYWVPEKPLSPLFYFMFSKNIFCEIAVTLENGFPNLLHTLLSKWTPHLAMCGCHRRNGIQTYIWRKPGFADGLDIHLSVERPAQNDSTWWLLRLSSACRDTTSEWLHCLSFLWVELPSSDMKQVRLGFNFKMLHSRDHFISQSVRIKAPPLKKYIFKIINLNKNLLFYGCLCWGNLCHRQHQYHHLPIPRERLDNLDIPIWGRRVGRGGGG